MQNILISTNCGLRGSRLITDIIYNVTGVKYFREIDDCIDEWDLSVYTDGIIHEGWFWVIDYSNELRTDEFVQSVFLFNSDDGEVKIVEIPDDVEWYIFEDDDGSESIHENHRVWR